MPIVLSLISHTNAGKTTLLRTLLRQDVGETGDRAHVTVEAKCYPLIELPDGESLQLWDTPGFGANLAKLAGRIRQESNPIGWILHQVWDRHRDASLFHSQTALRNVKEHADVVVYI
ncbi:MAG: GTPase domain-containing protein, partial [Verrucomicrobiae bacterium]|nr:GTPase domain-containing protein [Verrucomicrobiae bacterium]